ncbi:hypothetical protein HID58_079283 [Brassica napus]|uniref:Bifunctional inhibitor/plant lipid transfer protein/seed storage helical domain-containing protein n=2 Tax=Brassica TaxID=3705 RepID=A0ABQ7Y1L8_BRANA|nr:hypothetical protein HID58_079283 [Brassica napus]
MRFTEVVCIAFMIVLVSALAPTKAYLEEKVACIPTELMTCIPALQTGSQPSAECCGKLKEQESCLCGYIQNPLFSQYVTSENAHKVLATCEKVASNPTELTPCIPAGQTGSQPSAECCGKLKEQESCLCKYINKRLFPPYVSSANVQKVLAACGVVCIAFVIVLLSALAPTKAVFEEKVACIPTELMTCIPALQTGSQPSAECCGKLKEQESCLCGYIQNPLFSQYVTSENAHKVLATCGIPYPTC